VVSAAVVEVAVGERAHNCPAHGYEKCGLDCGAAYRVSGTGTDTRVPGNFTYIRLHGCNQPVPRWAELED
jgi:hypothetical protein